MNCRSQVRSSRATYGPALTGPRDARPASLPSREPSARAPTPRGQQAKRSGARGPGGAAVLLIGASRVARTPSRRTSAHARGAASQAGALTCGGTSSCPPGAAAAAASSRRSGPRPAPSGDSASPGGPPRSERGHADCWGPGPARALFPRPSASRLRRHLKRQSPISRRRFGSRAWAASGPFNAWSR